MIPWRGRITVKDGVIYNNDIRVGKLRADPGGRGNVKLVYDERTLNEVGEIRTEILKDIMYDTSGKEIGELVDNPLDSGKLLIRY